MTTLASATGTITFPAGFMPPRYHTASEIDEARFVHEYLPMFRAVMGGIDWRPPEVRWAHDRERELRAVRRMWDWPRVPEAAA